MKVLLFVLLAEAAMVSYGPQGRGNEDKRELRLKGNDVGVVYVNDEKLVDINGSDADNRSNKLHPKTLKEYKKKSRKIKKRVDALHREIEDIEDCYCSNDE